MTKDALGVRMKSYEAESRSYLERHKPVIIRIDGKAFHTFTKGFVKPFDDVLIKAMQATMKYLCENIQGCVFGYTQSDEITLVLTDYANENTDAWFGYNIQKMASVAASMATMAFNCFFKKEIYNWWNAKTGEVDWKSEGWKKLDEQLGIYTIALNKGAMFDARCFSVPKYEVVNCFIWRQQDAERNSIQSTGQANFSHKELHGKNCSQIIDMLANVNIAWEDFATFYKRGSTCYKDTCCKGINPDTGEPIIRKSWLIDLNIPKFVEDKPFIEQWL